MRQILLATQGTRSLVPGSEFGAPLDPDTAINEPVASFQEYAKSAPVKVHHHHDGDDPATSADVGGRKDGRAELLVIGRQEWASTVKNSRYVKLISQKTHQPQMKRAPFYVCYSSYTMQIFRASTRAFYRFRGFY